MVFGRVDVNREAAVRTRLERAEELRLAATATAPSCGRLFVRHVCTGWGVDEDQLDTAILLASELLSNAVAATGILEANPQYPVIHALAKLMGIRLLAYEHSLVIEVWDTSLDPPKLVEPDLDAESGRGLQLIKALSSRWGYYYGTIGKWIWCEIARQ